MSLVLGQITMVSMETIIIGLCPKENIIFRHAPCFDTGMKLRLQELVPSSYLSMISHLKPEAEQAETGHREIQIEMHIQTDRKQAT